MSEDAEQYEVLLVGAMAQLHHVWRKNWMYTTPISRALRPLSGYLGRREPICVFETPYVIEHKPVPNWRNALIVQAYESGETGPELAVRFGLSRNYIYQIIRQERYAREGLFRSLFDYREDRTQPLDIVLRVGMPGKRRVDYVVVQRYRPNPPK